MSDTPAGKEVKPKGLAPLVFAAIAIVTTVLEFKGVFSRQSGDTITESYRGYVRFTTIGRLVSWSLYAWLGWHFFLRPEGDRSESWIDLVFVGIGVACALYEILSRRNISLYLPH